MWLEEVVIKDLFCYRGTVKFDFRRPAHATDEQCVALVWGRNGQGKTSFLNSMKLLLGGPRDDLLTLMFRGKNPSKTQFILGWGDEWSGIVNNLAWGGGRQEVKARVEATWQDSKIGPFRVEREWTINRKANSYRESITITSGTRTIDDNDEAVEWLENVFPSGYVDFVMYDGEQIQELADSDDTTRRETMEKLLDIVPIDQLRDNAKKARATWAREARIGDEQHKLEKLEHDLSGIEIELRSVQRELFDKRNEVKKIDHERKELADDLDEIDLSGPVASRAELVGRRDELERVLEQQRMTIARDVMVDAPFLFNRALVAQASEVLSTLGPSKERTEAKLLNDLLMDLGTELFERSPHAQPPIGDAQRRFYQNKLQKLLEMRRPPEVDSGVSIKLTLVDDERHRLITQLQDFAKADGRRRERLNAIETYIQRREELRETRQKLEDLSDFAEEYRQQIKAKRDAVNQLQVKIDRLKDEIRDHVTKEGDLQRRQQELTASIERQRQAVERALVVSRQAETAERLVGFLEDFAKTVRSKRRAQLEKRVNEHCEKLLHSNRLVKNIQIDTNFRMSYYSDGGVLIGKKNMSAGMRQLIATALLWALKDESGIQLPVVVDTPLARLDRDHQLVLLTEYFTKAAQQMILLPTDSEIDREKYLRIRPHVYTEYVLQNPRGNDARLVAKSVHGDIAQ